MIILTFSSLRVYIFRIESKVFGNYEFLRKVFE